jgi:hypothetical protein
LNAGLGLSAHRGFCICLAFERIVQVRMTPTNELRNTGCYIERKEKHTPALVLLHMHELMRADARKKRVIEADDNVAESNRGKASAGREARHQVMQVTAGDLDHAVDNARCCACTHCDDREQQPDCCRGRHPGIANAELEATHRMVLVRPNGTKLTGPPPPTLAKQKACTGGSG